MLQIGFSLPLAVSQERQDLSMNWNLIFWITFFCFLVVMMLITIPIVAYLEWKDGKPICGYSLAEESVHQYHGHRHRHRHKHSSIDEGIDLCYDTTHVWVPLPVLYNEDVLKATSLVLEKSLTCDMVKEVLRKKILKNYYSFKFPSSFGGVSSFRKSLKQNLDIDISHAALRRILKSSLPYQVNVIKPKKFKTRKLYSRGCYIEAYCDPIFIP